jgi:hypothetical protein
LQYSAVPVENKMVILDKFDGTVGLKLHTDMKVARVWLDGTSRTVPLFKDTAIYI